MSGTAIKPILASRIGLGLLSIIPAQAFAHSGPGAHIGFLQGLLHPVSGVDHVLVMAGVGLFAATLGARARWALPATFVTVMALAAAAAMAGLIGGAPAEHLIALSVIVIGVPIALASKPGLPSAMALVALCAAVHGHAHGVELPAAASASAFLPGLVISTALLHATGALAGMGLNRLSFAGHALARGVGAVMVLAGLGLACA